MKRIDRQHRRPGFTLIELIVVISIIALLLALSAGGFFRVRNSQMNKASIATVNKVEGALDNRVKAIRDSVQADAKSNLGQYPNAMKAANNDPDLAKTLLMYAKMKNELPMTFTEAKTNTVVSTANGTITLPARRPFATLGTGNNSPEESGVCLYIALTTNGGDGAAAEGGWDQQAITTSINGVDYKTFADAWGTPLAFVRNCYASEVQSAPYVKGAAADPYDPMRKAAGKVTWSQIAPPALTGFTPPGSYNPAANHVPTVISAGPNLKWGADLFTNEDNLYGFRLRREGTQGY